MIHQGRIIGEGTPAELRVQTGRDSLRDIFAGLIDENGGLESDMRDLGKEEAGKRRVRR